MIITLPAEPISIGIAEPSELVRKGISRMLNEQENFDIIWDVDSGAALQQSLLLRQPKIIVMELQLKGICCFQLMEWLQTTYPEVHVIVLTSFKTDLTQMKLLKSGARAILKKDSSEHSLCHAIKAVSEMGFYYTNSISRSIFNYLYNHQLSADCQQKLQQLLTAREWDFMKLAATELTYHQIAGKMQLNVPTINKIRNQLFVKLDIANRSRLAAVALENGITDDMVA